MTDEKTPPAPTGMNPPKGQKIWQCLHCSRLYLTEQPPEKCPFCLAPVKES